MLSAASCGDASGGVAAARSGTGGGNPATAPPKHDPSPELEPGLTPDAGEGACAIGSVRACYDGPATSEGTGACAAGSQRCELIGELGSWGPCLGSTVPSEELCGNGLDDDCDGEVDEDCVDECLIEVNINVNGDCVKVDCPPEAPYPVGCSVKFVGDTPVGCVASQPESSTVFLKEGVVCDAGYLTGTLICACQPGAGLTADNCAINKKNKFYVTSAAECP
jgi:hypothetical protein